MINAARSVQALAWVTFCRGDAVEVINDVGQITETTEVLAVTGECVFTSCGHRWQQGTGEQIVVICGGRAETLSDLKIRPCTSSAIGPQDNRSE